MLCRLKTQQEVAGVDRSAVCGVTAVQEGVWHASLWAFLTANISKTLDPKEHSWQIVGACSTKFPNRLRYRGTESSGEPAF